MFGNFRIKCFNLHFSTIYIYLYGSLHPILRNEWMPLFIANNNKNLSENVPP